MEDFGQFAFSEQIKGGEATEKMGGGGRRGGGHMIGSSFSGCICVNPRFIRGHSRMFLGGVNGIADPDGAANEVSLTTNCLRDFFY